MRLQFVAPLLHELDAVEAEALACVVWEDELPMPGLVGLCDWRFAGRLSRLRIDRFLTGRIDEVVLVPGRPLFGFDKLLLLGGGARKDFDEKRFELIIDRMLTVLDDLDCRSIVAELPGRHADWITAERAADRLLEALLGPRARQSAWTLVEDPEARRRIEQHMVEERRRLRLGP
ncbi:MAG: leucyl aminopeptidase [Deltaproteobacteria bacterium]|nr:leucyl aminopeptidase [Deltaproteobacteria bacterium]